MNRQLREMFAMFETRLDLTLFLTEPIGRTLRLLTRLRAASGLRCPSPSCPSPKGDPIKTRPSIWLVR
jgi:hypothetical protein